MVFRKHGSVSASLGVGFCYAIVLLSLVPTYFWAGTPLDSAAPKLLSRSCGHSGSLLYKYNEIHGADVNAVAWCCPANAFFDDTGMSFCALAIGGVQSPIDGATVRIYTIDTDTGSLDVALTIATGNTVNALAWCYAGDDLYYLAVAGSNLTDGSFGSGATGDVLVYVLDTLGGDLAFDCVTGYTHGAPLYSLAWLCRSCGAYVPDITDDAIDLACLAIGGTAGTDGATARVLSFYGPPYNNSESCISDDPTYSLQTPVTVMALSWCCRAGYPPLLAAGGTPCDPETPNCSNPACQETLACLCSHNDYCTTNSAACCTPSGPGGPCCNCANMAYCQSNQTLCCSNGSTWPCCQHFFQNVSPVATTSTGRSVDGDRSGSAPCRVKRVPVCANPVIFVYAFTDAAASDIGQPSPIAQRCCSGAVNMLSWCCPGATCPNMPILAVGCTPANTQGKNVVLYALANDLGLKEFASATMAANGLKSIKSVAWYPSCPCKYLAAAGILDNALGQQANVIIYERAPHEHVLKAIAGAQFNSAVNAVDWCACSGDCVYCAAGSASAGSAYPDVAVWQAALRCTV